jgi:hypothetical protein
MGLPKYWLSARDLIDGCVPRIRVCISIFLFIKLGKFAAVNASKDTVDAPFFFLFTRRDLVSGSSCSRLHEDGETGFHRFVDGLAGKTLGVGCAKAARRAGTLRVAATAVDAVTKAIVDEAFMWLTIGPGGDVAVGEVESFVIRLVFL